MAWIPTTRVSPAARILWKTSRRSQCDTETECDKQRKSRDQSNGSTEAQFLGYRHEDEVCLRRRNEVRPGRSPDPHR